GPYTRRSPEPADRLPRRRPPWNASSASARLLQPHAFAARRLRPGLIAAQLTRHGDELPVAPPQFDWVAPRQCVGTQRELFGLHVIALSVADHGQVLPQHGVRGRYAQR